MPKRNVIDDGGFAYRQTMAAHKKKYDKLKLNWEYCECGCHCHIASIGGHHFALYQDLQGGYFLRDRCRCPSKDVRYSSWEAADQAAFDEAHAKISKTSGVVSVEEIRKLIRRAARERYKCNALAKTYKAKHDTVGYEGAIREALAFKRMEDELKKLCEESQ